LLYGCGGVVFWVVGGWGGGGGGGGRGCDSVFGMNLASYVNSVVKIDSTLSYVIPY